jgi:two-component system sensor histidine kinase KdpD
VEASGLALKKEPHNLARLIPAAVDEMRVTAGHRAIQVSIPESLPPAECDSDMLARVLKQLLSNALKYSPDDSPLSVSAEFTGEAVVIDVVDRGPGVDGEERERIFEKYYRGRAALSRTPGTGLGLASARSIMRAHGGEIWLTSPPAGGAAFHMSLPVKMASHMRGG